MARAMLYEQPLRLEFEGQNLFVAGEARQPDVRTAGQMLDVVADKTSIADKNQGVYFMYRGVHSAGNLRYDITVIPWQKYGPEFNKTYGHYHPDGYAEVYHILFGSAVFVLQSRNSDGSVDVILVEGRQGNIVLIPPGYGHVTVNNSKGTLFLANVVSSSFSSEYDEYKAKAGAAIYYKETGPSANKNYSVRNIRFLSPDELNKKYSFAGGDLLKEFFERPNKFQFLDRAGQ